MKNYRTIFSVFYGLLFTINLQAANDEPLRHIVWSNSGLHNTINVTDVKDVKQLLADGFAMDTPNDEGRTLLHSAAMYGDVEIVKLLILQRANLGIKDKLGCTALEYAAGQNGCIAWEYPNKQNGSVITKLIAAAMTYRGIKLPDFLGVEPEAIRIGRNIGLAIFRARIGQLGFPLSRFPGHTEIMKFIGTLEKPILGSRL